MNTSSIAAVFWLLKGTITLLLRYMLYLFIGLILAGFTT